MDDNPQTPPQTPPEHVGSPLLPEPPAGRRVVPWILLAALIVVIAGGLLAYRYGALEKLIDRFRGEETSLTPFERAARGGSWLLVQGKPDEALAHLRETLSLAKNPSEEAYAKTQLATALFQTEDDPTEAVTLLKEVATNESYLARQRAFAYDILAQRFLNTRTDEMRQAIFSTPPFDAFYNAALKPQAAADFNAARVLYEFIQQLSPTFLSYLWPGHWYATSATLVSDEQQMRDYAKRALENYRRGSALLNTSTGYVGWAPSVRGKGRLFEALLSERLTVLKDQGFLEGEADTDVLTFADTRSKYRDLIANLDKLAEQGDYSGHALSIAARAYFITFLAAHLPQSAERDGEIVAVSDALAAAAQKATRRDVVSRLSFLATDPAVVGILEDTREGARRAAAVAPSFKEVLREYVSGWGQ